MRGAAVLAVAAGGVVGALARFGLQTAVPCRWTTFAINVAGCLLIGALMPLLEGRRLLQPFVAPGILGGFTTFSAYAVDASPVGPSWTAALYLAGTLAGALVAVWAGATLTGRLTR